MEGILASENFREFIQAVTADNYVSTKQLEEGFKERIQIIAKEIKLGQLSSLYIAPKTPTNPDGIKSLSIMYISPDGFENDPYEKCYGTGEGGTVTMIFNPSKGEEWDEDTISELDMLSDYIYTVSAKARLTTKIIELGNIIENISRH